MIDLSLAKEQIHVVANFRDLVSSPFHGERNAVCWKRNLIGNFAEIVDKVAQNENITNLEVDDLLALKLSEEGHLARQVLINDLKLLTAQGASPVLNVIDHYERDHTFPFFPTDVYSFHVDRSPIPTDTFLCTYYGAPSELLPNAQAQKKVLIPEIREQLKELYDGNDEGFDAFLSEHFFDLHYQAKPQSTPISLGIGHLWKLAIDHPEMQSLPCVHRAPIEAKGQKRLLMIC